MFQVKSCNLQGDGYNGGDYDDEIQGKQVLTSVLFLLPFLACLQDYMLDMIARLGNIYFRLNLIL